MTDPGQRPHLVTIQRRGTPTDDGYTSQPGAWAEYAKGWARVRHGSGSERREAAQERASQTATFEFDWSPTLAGVKTTDRLVCFDTAWDVTSPAVIGENRDLHITAIANLDAVVEIES